MIEFPIRIECTQPQLSFGDSCEVRVLARDLIEGTSSTFRFSEGLGFGRHLERFADWIGEDDSPNLWLNLVGSNYLLATPDRQAAIRANLCLRLLGESGTALFIGFERKERGYTMHFLDRPRDTHLPPLVFNAETVVEFEHLLRSREHLAGGKIELLEQVYLQSQTQFTRAESRFLTAVTVMESIVLPRKVERGRISDEFAKGVAARMEADGRTTYEGERKRAKKLYKVRSSIAHTGTHEDVHLLLPEAEEKARRLLKLYMLDSRHQQSRRSARR
jgi:Apea-like HEPN